MAENSDGKTKRIQDFSFPVHRSIIKRDLWLGIPLLPLILLIFSTIIIVLGFGQPAFLVVTVVLWFVLKQIAKNDEWLLDIILTSLLQPDNLR